MIYREAAFLPKGSGQIPGRMEKGKEVGKVDERAKRIMASLESNKLGLDDTFKFSCRMCGKCCIHREDIILTPRDIFNMSKELGIKPEGLVDKYCEIYVGPDSRVPIVRTQPRGSVRRCPLLKDRKCMVHKAKPVVCAMYPIGRGMKLKGKDIDSIKTDDITFFLNNGVSCGGGSEEHTVREWLGKFGIPIQDNYFIQWQKILFSLFSAFREIEKKADAQVMELLWNVTIFSLYIDYDTGQDFQQQFERNSKKIVSVVNDISRTL